MPNEPPLFALPCRTQRRPAPLACSREHEPTKKLEASLIIVGLAILTSFCVEFHSFRMRVARTKRRATEGLP